MKLTSDFSIREAVASDVATIWRLNCSEMGYQYPLDDTAQNLTKILRSSADKIFVAVYAGSVVGYVHANDYDLLYAPHMKNIMGMPYIISRQRYFILLRNLSARLRFFYDTMEKGIEPTKRKVPKCRGQNTAQFHNNIREYFTRNQPAERYS